MLVPSLRDIDRQTDPRRSRLVLGVVIGAAMAFVAVGAVMAMGLLWRWSTGNDTSAAVQIAIAEATQARPKPGTQASPETPVQPSTVVKSATVRLESEPSDAAVEWQGQVVGRTPIQLTVPLGIQYFAVSQLGYKRQDVVIDTSVAAGPEGFSTKVLLMAGEKPQKLLAGSARRGEAGVGRGESETDRVAARSRAEAVVSAKEPASLNPSADVAAAAIRPASPAPRIRTIDAKSPNIRTIDADTAGDSHKVRVINDD